MLSETGRDTWSSRWSFVLAAAGSAVGLGNLWKFPYITWNNQGGAFVLVYLACILVIGLPVMIAEITIGRRSRSSPVPAFRKLGHPRWTFVGWLGAITGVVILSFYTVIAGWSLRSFELCLEWSFLGYETPAPDAFDTFLATGWAQIALGLTFLLITAFIVVRGVSSGIEKATRVLMPALFAIMIYLLVVAMTLDGFGEALRFLFRPDFASLGAHGVLEALGHAFFTLSLGMGAMITYGSYVSHDDSVAEISFTVALLDTLIALLACTVMFTIIFSVPSLRESMDGGGSASTVGMLFVTLPNLFYTQMAGGALLGPLFYVLVGFAALSSTISLLEVVVATFVDRFDWSRQKATLVAVGIVFFFSIGNALSLGASSTMSTVSVGTVIGAGKEGVLAIFDHVAANWLLPLGGLSVTLFAGWAMDEETIERAIGTGPVAKVWRILVRYICPLAIGWIIFEVLRGGDFS